MKKALIFALFLFSACGQVGDDMTTKIIADSIISEDHFLSATEQAGGRIEQPEPATANTGSLKLISKGTIADLDYSGTATADGAAGGTTVIDSLLVVYGDDYLIGGTVTLLTTAGESELVINGGFDSDTTGWTARHGATISSVGGGQAGNCLRIACGASDNPYAQSDNIVVTAATQYRLSFYVKVGSEATYDVKVYDATNSAYITAAAVTGEAGDWGHHEKVFTTPAGCVSLYIELIQVAVGGAGTTQYYDTVVLKELATSETKTITDSAQSTGTLTTAAFSESVLSGTVLAVNVDADTRDFKIELIASGDAGDADFKWTHDGTNYLGRDDPDAATWLNEFQISDTEDGSIGYAACRAGAIIRRDDGNLICVGPIYNTITLDESLGIWKSTDPDGIFWTDPDFTAAAGASWDYYPGQGPFSGAIKAQSGRIFAYSYGGVNYSDDDGDTWARSSYTSDVAWSKVIQLDNGKFLQIKQTSGTIVCYSSDDGFAFTDAVTVTTGVGADTGMPGVVQAQNGDIVAVYHTYSDDVTNYEIKSKISSDGGATWGIEIDVLNYGAVGLMNPAICRDINGDLYVVALEDLAGDNPTAAAKAIVGICSTDDGKTWGTKRTLISDVAAIYQSADINLVITNAGPRLVCLYHIPGIGTDASLKIIHRGQWEAYSAGANECPTAINGLEQKLICDVGLEWHGGAGIVGDIWTMDEILYDYRMANLVIPSPSRPWRSSNDNIACSIVLDAGANARFFCTGIGMFNTNFRTASFQMNATDSWGTPSVDESLSTDVTTAGVIDSVSGNYVQDAALMASYDDHQLSSKGKAEKYFLRALNGTDAGLTWEILDNVGDYIILDTTSAHNMAITDTFTIYRSWVAKTFSGGVYRFIRILIDAQQTSDDYYQIGTMVSGIATALSRQWGIGMGHDYTYDIDLMTTPRGGGFPIKGADRKRNWKLVWRASETTRKEMLAIADYTEARPMVLIPDAGTMAESYLVHKTGGIPQTNRFHEKFDFTVKLIEVI